MKSAIYLLTAAVLIISLSISHAGEMVDARKIKAKRVAVEITDMRSRLAASLIQSGMDVTPELFKNVCGAVKKRAMELTNEEGVKIRHAAVKNRNPDHAASGEEITMHQVFDENRGTEEMSDEITKDGKRYYRYVRPIFVEPACLACHGDKDERPGFIAKKYPGDKAYGFGVGDLRGIIEVMIPVE